MTKIKAHLKWLPKKITAKQPIVKAYMVGIGTGLVLPSIKNGVMWLIKLLVKLWI